MTTKRVFGDAGEAFACTYLEEKGMAVLERNFHCRAGEIDVIAREGDTVVFAEVKTRSGRSFGSAAEAVGAAKQKKLTRTALEYIAQKGISGDNYRFDVMEVYVTDGRFQVNHIENAFEAAKE